MAISEKHLKISYALATLTVVVAAFSFFIVLGKYYPAPPIFKFGGPSGAATSIDAVEIPDSGGSGGENEPAAAPAQKPKLGGGMDISPADIGVSYGDVSVKDVTWRKDNPVLSSCKLTVSGIVNNTGDSALDGTVVCTAYNSIDVIVATLKETFYSFPPESVNTFEITKDIDCAVEVAKYKCDFLTPPCDLEEGS